MGKEGVTSSLQLRKLRSTKYLTQRHVKQETKLHTCFKLRLVLLQQIGCKVLCFACGLEVLLLFLIHMHSKVFISIYFICTCKYLKIFVDI